jgi:CheY-like chemotaxis protein/anti-sigma regulatory factor (Ser/Thr protein kinase)
VLQLFQPLAGDKGLTVALELDEPEAEIVFDEYCLTHALRNLVGNAIKFTEAGSVTVRLFREASDRLAIEVRDTGVGIEDAYLPFLFKPFSQQESGYTRRFEGSGIGLAVTRRYLELNSASISVDTEKGCGSTFTVRFASDVAPAAAAAAAAQAPAPGPGPRARERATVLLVEDDPPTQAFMKQMLAPKFEVVCAATGEEARAQLAAHDVQMVLMDLSLRGPEDGLMLTRWLRQQARWEAVPVIATTAHALPEDRRKALAAGCDAYLAKPFHPSALLSLMQSLLPSSPEAPNPA